MESWVQSWRPRTNAFCDFSTPPVYSTAPATKNWCQVIRSAAPVTQNHLSKPEDLMLQNPTQIQPLSGNQRADLPTSLMNMSFVLRLPREMHLWRSSSNVLRLPSFLEMLQNLAFCSLLTRCAIPCAYHAKRALNVQKWSVHGVLCAFWLRNVLRATTACTFSTSQLPKVVRTWCALCIFTSKCASRHNGVQLFISHLTTWLRTRRFSEPTFRPSGATNHWKNTVFRDFPTFSRICSFFLLTLSLLWSSLFYSSLLSDSSHLCFSSVHIVGSLTSKLPSNSPTALVFKTVLSSLPGDWGVLAARGLLPGGSGLPLFREL